MVSSDEISNLIKRLKKRKWEIRKRKESGHLERKWGEVIKIMVVL